MQRLVSRSKALEIMEKRTCMMDWIRMYWDMIHMEHFTVILHRVLSIKTCSSLVPACLKALMHHPDISKHTILKPENWPGYFILFRFLVNTDMKHGLKILIKKLGALTPGLGLW